ncbi:MAG: MetQ/NlpA family ABC transporter substrate-binding protein [Fretibacterium sp.]|nr:MetQ/NlpA family ABC transporter substrate-binding protein [Fretibacterium sp.]
MRRLFALILTVLSFWASGVAAQERVRVRLGITDEASEILWNPVKEEVAADGIDLEYVLFGDYTLPNSALANKEIELNAFQHYTYLNKEIATFGYRLTAIGDTLITALNLYSRKLSRVADIPEGGKIAVPNDAVNEGRALNVLQAAGLLKIAEGKGLSPTLTDIVENPKNIEFIEVDASQTASLLPDVDAAIVNGGYAVDAGLNPDKDAIFIDDPSFYKDKAYVNTIVARTEDADNPVYLRIVKAYQSERTKELYRTAFKGMYIPAWK